MDIVVRRVIDSFIKKHPDGKGSVKAWYYEAKQALWNNPMDIKQQYANASFLADNIVIFNIKGNGYRLVTKIAYNTKKVFIKWIGTHAEYNKKKF